MPLAPETLLQAGLAAGLFTAEQLRRWQRQARQKRQAVLDYVTAQGRFPLAALYRAVAQQRGLPFVDVNTARVDARLWGRMPAALRARGSVVPLYQENGTLHVATTDPDDQATLDRLGQLFGCRLRVHLADPEAVRRLGARSLQGAGQVEAGAASATGAVELMDEVIQQAFLHRASDVHVEPTAQGYQIRFRIDGHLQPFLVDLDRTTGVSLTTRVKVLAGLDIAQQRAPQDGRFSYQPPGRDDVTLDIRVATIPTRWGERATLRLLGCETVQLRLEALGFADEDLEQFRRAIRAPHGMVLLTGPTGSGKTTTLYAAMSELDRTRRNILTVEDPIEYLLPGVSQIQVDGQLVTFASALRSLLRHDPDVIMVGEIRDLETADVAIKAAMTGHLIFSTLHTNSALGAVTRLVDIGCAPYLVASTLQVVVAQRLVRRLCSRCRRRRRVTPAEAELLQVEPETEIYEPAPGGCAACLGSGYFGRLGLFEPLWITPELRRLVAQGANQTQLEQHLRGKYKTLRQDGLAKVLQGLTTVAEVVQATV